MPSVCARGVAFVVVRAWASTSNAMETFVQSDSSCSAASGLGCSRSAGSLCFLSGVTVKKVTKCCHKLLPLIVLSGIMSAIIANCRASHVSLLETMLLGGGCSSSSSAQDQFQLPAVTLWRRGLSRTLNPLLDLSVAFCKYDSR